MTRGITNVRSPGNLWRDEGGMLTMINTLAVAFCVVLIVFVINTGHLVHQKIEMQNAADAVAYSGGLWQARGMNAITATNHVIGEMLAFVVLHEAIGGQRLDDPSLGPSPKTRDADRALEAAWTTARGLGAQAPAYRTVRERRGVYADRTILKSKTRLKEILTGIYVTKAFARGMQHSPIPWVVAAGRALELLMDGAELLVLHEYRLLTAWHQVARALVPLKQALRDELLPEAKRYTTYVVRQTPLLAERAAREIAPRNRTLGTLFPTRPQLPVEIDPFAAATAPFIADRFRLPAPKARPSQPIVLATNLRRQVVKTSQLCRATFPWVNYHRRPILQVLAVLVPLSNAKNFYFDETGGACIDLCDHLQTHHDMGLYVLKGYPAPDKGYALWTDDPARADELFSLVGLTWRGPPQVAGQPGIFRQAHPDGRVALSQVLLYNANRERRARSHRPGLQTPRAPAAGRRRLGHTQLAGRHATI